VQPDPAMGPNTPPPDSVPDDMLALYGRQAHRTVRYHRSMRYRLTRRIRGVATSANPQIWETTAVVFCLAIIAVLFLGGLTYAVFLWPTVGITLIVTLVTLLALSYVIARRITKKDADRDDPLAF
jgi:heme exporter protein D